jgi:energy-coupling factor transporter transmembrane protein EcfT
MTRFRKHTSYIIPLTLRALKIVSDLSIAMESRAYDPYTPRTFVRELKMSRSDYAILIGMVIFLVVSIIIRAFGFGVLQLGLLGSGQ